MITFLRRLRGRSGRHRVDLFVVGEATTRPPSSTTTTTTVDATVKAPHEDA